jgi:L-alanine-DL-glutamate epimerase-like enolase superfamily enzyme
MRIVDGQVIVCCPGRNFVTLKLVTEDGVHGLGDATLNGRELAVASYLTDHVVPLLINRDARRIEDTWQYLYKGAYWRRGPVTMAAIGAVDTALWDIAGKTLNVPVHQLLGGASRDRVMVYSHANSLTSRSSDTRRFAPSAVSPGSSTPTASRRGRRHTSPPRKGARWRRSGAARHTWPSCRQCSNGCGRSSVNTCTCFTTCTTG